MRKVYLIREDRVVSKARSETYDMMLAAVKHDYPSAQRVAESEEISKLHDLLALMRCDLISIKSYDLAGVRCFTLEIDEDCRLVGATNSTRRAPNLFNNIQVNEQPLCEKMNTGAIHSL